MAHPDEPGRPIYTIDSDIGLAYAMLDWHNKMQAILLLEKRIQSYIIGHKKTVTVANIRCTYSEGRTSYESYENAYERIYNDLLDGGIDEEVLDTFDAIENDFSEKVIETNWKEVCETLNLEREILNHGTPSATLKILK